MGLGTPSSPGSPTDVVLYAVEMERARQHVLIREGKFAWACDASEIMHEGWPDRFTKLAVLAEEFGEVSQLVCKSIGGPLEKAKLKEELIQVAAVCVAWAESL